MNFFGALYFDYTAQYSLATVNSNFAHHTPYSDSRLATKLSTYHNAESLSYLYTRLPSTPRLLPASSSHRSSIVSPNHDLRATHDSRPQSAQSTQMNNFGPSFEGQQGPSRTAPSPQGQLQNTTTNTNSMGMLPNPNGLPNGVSFPGGGFPGGLPGSGGHPGALGLGGIQGSLPGLMAGLPTPAGHQSDIAYVYTMVEELSRVLEQNRAQTERINNAVGRVRGRAMEMGMTGEGVLGRVAGELNGMWPLALLPSCPNEDGIGYSWSCIAGVLNHQSLTRGFGSLTSFFRGFAQTQAATSPRKTPTSSPP